MAGKASSGMGLLGIVFVVFLILKLAEIGAVAKWSWWYVTAPLWVPFAVYIAVGLILLFLSLIFGKK